MQNKLNYLIKSQENGTSFRLYHRLRSSSDDAYNLYNLGVCIGIKFSKALKSGLLVGVGFVGLSVVTALLTSSLGPALSQVVEIYGLQLKVFDMGWPAAAAVAYNTSVGAFIIPVCLGVNLLMLLTKTTRTVNIDLWNYWHFAFIGAVVYFASDNIWWGFFAAIICYIITLIMADYTADKFQDSTTRWRVSPFPSLSAQVSFHLP